MKMTETLWSSMENQHKSWQYMQHVLNLFWHNFECPSCSGQKMTAEVHVQQARQTIQSVQSKRESMESAWIWSLCYFILFVAGFRRWSLTRSFGIFSCLVMGRSLISLTWMRSKMQNEQSQAPNKMHGHCRDWCASTVILLIFHTFYWSPFSQYFLLSISYIDRPSPSKTGDQTTRPALLV